MSPVAEFGKRRTSGPHKVQATRAYTFEDYPPGTTLPRLATPDLSKMNPLLRAWAQRRLRKAMALQQAQVEQARDDYWRRKGAGDSDA